MSRLSSFRSIVKQKGIKGLLSHINRKLTGASDCQDEINTLFYFLNQACDITKFPKATGNLRRLQEADTLLLAIVDKVLRKYDVEYWLDAGTCLGSVRHQGFIPWDDDLDICIFRVDFNKTINALNEELDKYDFSIAADEDRPGCRIGVGYKTAETGVWLDIFPADFSTVECCDYKASDALEAVCKKYYKKWNANKKKWTIDYANKQRTNMVSSICEKKGAKSILYNLESDGGMILDIYSVLPTKEAEFEQFMFKIPNNADYYLRKQYGDTYMEFPHWGVNHHESEQGLIQNWAEKNGVNMEEVIAYLNSVLKKV